MKGPTETQKFWLTAVRDRVVLMLARPPRVTLATIRACEQAGWVKVDGHGHPRLTALGRDALAGREKVGE